jgi:biotin synthase
LPVARMQPPPSTFEFEAALERGRRGMVDLQTAETLLRGAYTVARQRELFAAAAELRDRRLGRRLTLTAHIHMVTECGVDPPCNYCSLSSRATSVNRERAQLTARELVRHVRDATERGVDAIVLVGGTNFDGADEEIRRLVPLVRDATPLDLALDIGPSLSEATVRWLPGLGLKTIYCSIETVNRRAFTRAKPGDRYEARAEFMDRVDRNGIQLGNVVMNGLGSPVDLLRSILDSKRYRHLSHLHISTFQPVRGTPWARRRPGSVSTSLKALAIARLALPDVQLGLAEVGVEDPHGVGRGPNQLEAGGGNTLAGLLLYKYAQIDQLDAIRRRVAELGFEAS